MKLYQKIVAFSLLVTLAVATAACAPPVVGKQTDQAVSNNLLEQNSELGAKPLDVTYTSAADKQDDQVNSTDQFNTSEYAAGYKAGYEDGFRDARASRAVSNQAQTVRTSYVPARRSSTNYAYIEPRRSGLGPKAKAALTIGGASAIGAGIGALAGGKKGAGIGALLGGGGAAVYTLYKNRNR